MKLKYARFTYDIRDNPVASIIMALLGFALGLFFIFSQNANKPISRDEAVYYVGEFDHYDSSSQKYKEIYFTDGSYLSVYPHTESAVFRNHMNALEKGTMLYILVNPNNGYVAEVRTETEELLNFELSQQEIDSYDDGYVWIGVVCCFAGCFLIFYAVGRILFKRNQDARQQARGSKGNQANGNSPTLRYADAEINCKMLLAASIQGYQVSYRRVKLVNELVINGCVYDEMKALIEFPHALYAVVDGHIIEAGYDEGSYSYIKFDGNMVKRKFRII